MITSVSAMKKLARGALIRSEPAEGLKIRGVKCKCGGHNLASSFVIGLSDLPKFGGANAPSCPNGFDGPADHNVAKICQNWYLQISYN
jgi:hypothetical protein